MPTVHLPKGMRDILPAQMILRQEVIATIQQVFRRYGFPPLETPAMERIETLTGKYGDEGDKLIFRVLKRGEGGQQGEVDQALRYDLTVPLARVIAMNPQLPMPFKRSQIQPVWRADRPQKGRFREFYQCDVDTVGAPCGLADAECLAVVHDSLLALGFQDFRIRLNHRRWLAALAAHAGVGREADLIVAIDKLDKIGREGVQAELRSRGLGEEAIARVWAGLEGAPLYGAEEADAELAQVESLALGMGVSRERLVIDRTLARGLDYYTGPVFETVLVDSGMGSVSGGGRYDGLIGMFSGRQIPAVGVSLGLERLIVLLEERRGAAGPRTATRAFVTIFSPETQGASLEAARVLRQAGVPTELSLLGGKLGRQLKQADAQGVPFALVIGPEEAAAGQVRLKDLRDGQEQVLALAEVVERLRA